MNKKSDQKTAKTAIYKRILSPQAIIVILLIITS